VTRLPSLRPVVIVGVAAALSAIGFAVGRSSAPTPTIAGRAATVPMTAAAAPGPIAVADALVRQLNDPTLSVDARDRLLHRVAGTYADALMAAFTPGPGFAQATGLSADAANQRFIAAVVPIAGRVVTASTAQARVAVWAVSVVATNRLGQLVESWSTETVDLQRVSGGWLLTGYRSSAGPVPVSTQPPSPLEAALIAFGSGAP
jgi:hypothetical protein